MNRNTLVLVGVFAALIIVAIVVMQKPGEQSSTVGSGEALATIDSLAIDRIEIKSPSERVVLEKQGVEWFLQQPIAYRADQNNVAELIHAVKTIEVKNVISDKPEKHSVFQVDSTGTFVTITEQNAEKAAFVLGKAGGSYTEFYARRISGNEVLLIGGGSPYIFSRPVKEWRDRTIVSVPRETIKQIQFAYGDTTFVLAFSDSAWMIGRESTQESVVNDLITSVSHVQADDFVDTLLTRLSKPTAQLSYAGTQISFFFVKGGDKYLVHSSSSPQWYEMQSWRANQLLKRKKDLVK